MENLDLDELTCKRLSTLKLDLMQEKKCNLNYDDVINYLIDCFQEQKWGHLGAEAAGG
jgi:hypothetical protein